MTPVPYIFADIFDSPWVILMVILGGPLINWLTKRREEAKEQQQQSGGKKSGTAEERAAMAELLRQLTGQPPAKAPVPPPLPARHDDEDEGELIVPSNRRSGPPKLPSTGGSAVQAINRERELAKQRVKQLKEEHRHLAGGDKYSKGRGVSKGKHKASPWRDHKKARQAFVASLIFAPPKGLEMDR